jgi:predicted ABC-class ATPase
MRRSADLEANLRRIDGKGYAAYRDLVGGWAVSLGRSGAGAELWIDHVQPDPFAPPSRLRLVVPASVASLPASALTTPLRRHATGDHLARLFRTAARGGRHVGTGRGGVVVIDAGGAEILERTSVQVSEAGVEVRFAAGLPAAGRRILGREARTLLLERIPQIAAASLLPGAWKPDALEAHLACVEDHAWLQGRLPGMKLVAFVADGAVLPRATGVSQEPLPGAVPWLSPNELAVEVNFPNAGTVRGAGIPEGVTLIVGGGYHGKSTLLRALERGVYPHIPGDGRERVVTRADAWKLRAEDGRRVPDLDISAFIGALPGGVDTRRFTTDSASGSTSMAANLVEALEAGTRLLLIDEDTSASNFLVRDARMQALVPKAGEPITPLVDRVRSLHADLGVSTVLVVGGAGDYLDVADHVLLMDAFHPREVTARAREVAESLPTRRAAEAPEPLTMPELRRVEPRSVDPAQTGRDKVKASEDELLWGREPIDLAAVEGLVDPSQTRAIGSALLYVLRRGLLGRMPLVEALREAEKVANAEGLQAWGRGDLARPRLLEMAAAAWRLRTTRVV